MLIFEKFLTPLLMKLRILFLLIVLSACTTAEEKIRNTVEARLFLSHNEFSTGTRTKIKFTDQEVTRKNPTGLFGYEGKSYTYAIERLSGGDSISKKPYFEVKWFDSDINEYSVFYLHEDGGHTYVSKDWVWYTPENRGKVISHVADDEASKKEKSYREQYDIYEAVRTANATPTAQSVK
jgi:hypothetical protein